MNFIHVNSTNINAIAKSGNDLIIKFNKGGIYLYKDAAVEFENLLSSSSKGKYFHQYIKDKYLCKKIY